MALLGRKCLPQEKRATHLLLKYSFYDLQVNPVSCVRTEGNLRLHTVLVDSVGETQSGCLTLLEI
jgi:hypothetical protein